MSIIWDYRATEKPERTATETPIPVYCYCKGRNQDTQCACYGSEKFYGPPRVQCCADQS